MSVIEGGNSVSQKSRTQHREGDSQRRFHTSALCICEFVMKICLTTVGDSWKEGCETKCQ